MAGVYLDLAADLAKKVALKATEGAKALTSVD